jgi:hypothetical protein
MILTRERDAVKNKLKLWAFYNYSDDEGVN